MNTSRKKMWPYPGLFRTLLIAAPLLGFTALFLTARFNREPAKQAKAITSSQDKSPLEGRVELVNQLRKESLHDSISNLPNFNDTVWVLGSMDAGNMSLPGTYRRARLYVPRLNRVRKILGEVNKNDCRDTVVPLIDALQHSAEGFAECYRSFNAEIANSKGGVILAAPNDYMKRTVLAPAATYILAELSSYNALPVMSKVYFLPGLIPVSRLFLFYAMHLLAVNHPKDHLSAHAAKALEEYIQTAKALSPPTLVEAPTWDASIEETDFRVVIANQRDILIDEPRIQLHIYPKDIEKLERLNGDPTPQLNVFVQKLDTFIKLAYP